MDVAPKLKEDLKASFRAVDGVANRLDNGFVEDTEANGFGFDSFCTGVPELTPLEGVPNNPPKVGLDGVALTLAG